MRRLLAFVAIAGLVSTSVGRAQEPPPPPVPPPAPKPSDDGGPARPPPPRSADPIEVRVEWDGSSAQVKVLLTGIDRLFALEGTDGDAEVLDELRAVLGAEREGRVEAGAEVQVVLVWPERLPRDRLKPVIAALVRAGFRKEEILFRVTD